MLMKAGLLPCERQAQSQKCDTMTQLDRRLAYVLMCPSLLLLSSGIKVSGTGMTLV